MGCSCVVRNRKELKLLLLCHHVRFRSFRIPLVTHRNKNPLVFLIDCLKAFMTFQFYMQVRRSILRWQCVPLQRKRARLTTN